MTENCDRVKVAVDPFCGAGGNIIQLARLFEKVIAVDIDVDKIVMAKQNAAIYGVLEKIEFVVGDFFKLANQIKGDVIVTSPPWGGPEYNKMDVIENVFMDRYLKLTLLYVRSNNNNGVSDVAPKPVDIYLHNSFHKNERYSLKTYQSYLVDDDTLVSSLHTSV